MKLEIELDLNKIDYDAINKQIQKKIEDMNIKEEYDIEKVIGRKISEAVSEQVDMCYNNYLEKYWKTPSSEGKDLVIQMTREEIGKRVTKILEDIFSNEYDEETLRTTMLKVLPDVFTSILFSRMEYNLVKKEHDYINQTRNIVRTEIENTANRMRI